MGFGRTILIIAVIAVALIALSGTVSAAASASSDELTINVSSDVITIGDIVSIKGTVAGSDSKTIYIYLTGVDLPSKGTALVGDIRNGRLPYEQKYLSGPSWDYSWDTGLIIGGLEQGTYTIYVSTDDSGVDKLKEGTYVSKEVEIIDPSVATESSPGEILLVIGSLAGVFMLAKFYRRK
ncbi:hypothetical protein Mpet_2149 [Methanolacinia petrolearia DSM 11571]|uniref:Uncharacterized protein n=1 Tax=Methanolacinia petrolearia (strain DSM 11571 / OCM 486 / SEBR 4847) TaxID=679926 RepID=E1RK84_METP4|nr:hypothetical protein [Methanolacinia petrolearia]ADN36897.1 hypothetical protein Mpet_2149 [Methanolacinia petrolearia DSM 11571]